MIIQYWFVYAKDTVAIPGGPWKHDGATADRAWAKFCAQRFKALKPRRSDYRIVRAERLDSQI